MQALSGGERGRLMLARALAKPSNLLVLDEPTNDLDLETLDLLEEMLGDYAGHRDPDQPRPRFPRSRRDLGDRAEGDGRWTEYAGGYSDMLAQRGADLSREAVKPAAAIEDNKAPKVSAPPGTSKRRLSFNEKHALETLPKMIARLQAEIVKHQRWLDDPDLFQKDRKRFDQASEALAKAQRELQEAEDRWLELEVLREEIEQA